MKIMIFSSSYSGGMGTFIDTFINNLHFVTNKVEIYIFSNFEKLDSEKHKQENVTIIQNEPRKKGKLSFFSQRYKKAKQAIRDIKPDIVYIHSPSYQHVMPYLLAALHDKNKAKVVFHSHNSVCRLKSQKLLRWLYSKRIDGRFACSEGAGKMMFGKNFGNSQHDLVIRNAIDIEKCRFNESGRNNLRNQLNADNKIIVGTVGRNSYSKNQQFLIQLASIVNDDYVFIIIGEGELRKQLEKQILDLNLSSKVILIGNNNEIGSWMSAFDIFLLPSLYEGLPYVAIEAQCSGLLCGFSDAITRECKLTDLSYFLKTNSIEKWKDFLLSFDPTNNYDRSKYSTILSETNFNAKNEVKIILEEMLKI